jgi:LmbE family N-acetylglucosaminyl deacetylase
VNNWQWSGARGPGHNHHLLVVAPHPDDEVLACAGLMRWAVEAGATVEIVAVTDGEASHRRSHRIQPAELVVRRAEERRRALGRLGLGHLAVHRLQLPDSAVAEHEADLTDWLVHRLACPTAPDARPDRGSDAAPPAGVGGGPGPDRAAGRRAGSPAGAVTTVVVPWEYDGHPDHEAVARAGLQAASVTGIGCWQVPIWSLVGGAFDVSADQLDLGRFAATKAEAARCFRTQLVALGPGADDGPVVHPGELETLTGPVERVLLSGNPA